MANQLASGTSTEGVQQLLLGSGVYDYYELNIGYLENLPARYYRGWLFLAYTYEFGGDTIVVELRGQEFYGHIMGFVPSAEERALGTLSIYCNWRESGIAWECIAQDLPYP